MSHRGRYRGRKIDPPSLGVAQNKTVVDVSHVGSTIETNLHGLRQVLQLLETATDEVKTYLWYECELIYECRVCRVMFRSLANFILHKRSYCKELYVRRSPVNFIEDTAIVYDSEEVEQQTRETPPSTDAEDSAVKAKSEKKRDLKTIVTRLGNKQKGQLNSDGASDGSVELEIKAADSEFNKLALEAIGEGVMGCFQTRLVKNGERETDDILMKSEVMELHSLLKSDEVILGPDGKIISQPIKQKNKTIPFDLCCHICNMSFSTKKTLTHHVKYKHNEMQQVYICPETGCRSSVFASTWSLFRHLFKVHRKTSVQMKKLRSQIRSTVIKRRDGAENAKQEIKNNDTQWNDNVNGSKDMQTCNICGKQFERKAALNSHAQFCSKRAISNNQSTKDLDGRSARTTRRDSTATRLNDGKAVGAIKRKSSILRKNVRKKEEQIQQDFGIEPQMDTEPQIYTTTATPQVDTITTKPQVDITFEPQVVILKTEPQIDTKLDSLPIKSEEIMLIETVEVPKDDILYISDDDELDSISLESKSMHYVKLNETKCIPCSYSFKNRNNLMAHMSSHFKWFNYQCKICLFKTYKQAKCEQHVKKSHPGRIVQETVLLLSLEDIIKNSCHFEPMERALIEPESDSELSEIDDEGSFRDGEGDRGILNRPDVRDPKVQKMIMEVIFGSGYEKGEGGGVRPCRMLNDTDSKPCDSKPFKKRKVIEQTDY